MKLGDIVRIKSGFLGEKPGVLGYVYEEYDIGGGVSGISIITENGVDLGGFNKKEQELYLEFIISTPFWYKFENVRKLREDFTKLIKPQFPTIRVRPNTEVNIKTDESGNQYIITDRNLVMFKKAGTDTKLLIAVVDGDTIELKKKRAVHLHRQTSAYGVNSFILEHLGKKTLRITETVDTEEGEHVNVYELPVEEAIGNGFEMAYQDYEPQTFLRLKFLELWQKA